MHTKEGERFVDSVAVGASTANNLGRGTCAQRGAESLDLSSYIIRILIASPVTKRTEVEENTSLVKVTFVKELVGGLTPRLSHSLVIEVHTLAVLMLLLTKFAEFHVNDLACSSSIVHRHGRLTRVNELLRCLPGRVVVLHLCWLRVTHELVVRGSLTPGLVIVSTLQRLLAAEGLLLLGAHGLHGLCRTLWDGLRTYRLLLLINIVHIDFVEVLARPGRR